MKISDYEFAMSKNMTPVQFAAWTGYKLWILQGGLK